MNITFTPNAEAKIADLCHHMAAYAVSLNLKGGGCAGFEYDWGMIYNKDDVEENDTVIDIFGDESGAHFVIGATSLMFLLGTEIDYVNTAFAANFEINNPNAQSACGCGISVNFDIDKLG